MTPDPNAQPIEDALAALAELDAGARVALLIGAEGAGLSPAALTDASARVRIPMADGVDSLNVAAAVAIGCYLVGRPYPQRS
jgi:tRNA G18 (ribose-2'-O)-methylase SpoU